MVNSAFYRDSTTELVHHFVYISQAESESLDIVTIARRNTVEFVEYAFLVVF